MCRAETMCPGTPYFEGASCLLTASLSPSYPLQCICLLSSASPTAMPATIPSYPSWEGGRRALPLQSMAASPVA